MATAREVFIAYAPEDEQWKRELEKHLSLLQRQGIISAWHAQQLLPGAESAQEIDTHLSQAQFILLLVSADFLASDEEWNIVIQQTMRRHVAGEVCVIPLLVRPADWKAAPFGELQALPRNQQAISIWSNPDEAFTQIVQELRQALAEWVLQQRVIFTSPQYLYDVALSFAGEDRVHAEALAGALRRYGVSVFYDKYEKNTLWGKDLYIHLSDLYQNKARYCVTFFSEHYVAKTWTKHELRAAQARAFTEQQEYILPIRLDETEIPGILPTTAYLTWEQETVESIVQAILKKLGNTSRKSVKGWLRECEEYREKGLYAKALIACEQALQIDPYNSDSYYEYGWILRKLERHEEALIAFEQAIQFDTKDDLGITLDLYRQKGYTLEDLKRYGEALTVYEQIIQREKAEAASSQRDPYGSYGDLCNIGDALLGLERYEEALAIYEQAIQIALNSTFSYDRKRSRALSDKGYTLYLLDRYEEALIVCEQVIQLTPKDAYAYRLKGDILDELKRDEEALVFFEKAVELDPKDVYTLLRKADLLSQRKRFEEALAVCEQAIQLDATDANIHTTKSNILVALGHFEAAHDEYVLATQLGYHE